MELFPSIHFGILNGWLMLAIIYGIFGLLLLIFPREVVQRLYDKSNWEHKNLPFIILGKLVAISALAIFFLTPLKLGEPVFLIGSTLFALGTIGFVVALINYRQTPLGQPVTQGIYQYSRNPQIAMLIASFYGIAIAIGSWTAVSLVLVAQVFNYFFQIREEERSCLAMYGDAYRDYMERVPRYFLFF